MYILHGCILLMYESLFFMHIYDRSQQTCMHIAIHTWRQYVMRIFSAHTISVVIHSHIIPTCSWSWTGCTEKTSQYLNFWFHCLSYINKFIRKQSMYIVPVNSLFSLSYRIQITALFFFSFSLIRFIWITGPNSYSTL